METGVSVSLQTLSATDTGFANIFITRLDQPGAKKAQIFGICPKSCSELCCQDCSQCFNFAIADHEAVRSLKAGGIEYETRILPERKKVVTLPKGEVPWGVEFENRWDDVASQGFVLFSVYPQQLEHVTLKP